MTYKCCDCNTFYILSNDHIDKIRTCENEDKTIETVKICSICGDKNVYGGETEYYNGKKEIVYFTRRYENGDEILPQFKNIPLENCNKKDAEFITKDNKNNILYLKRGLIGNDNDK